jgi:hypothetical protein
MSTGESQLSLQAGARGDDASTGNMGVRAEIRTHLYRAGPGEFDYFWVGTVLQNGAFIQFGYAFEPGYFCLEGALVNGNFQCDGSFALLSDLDARWQWQYWPNIYGTDFYYEIGPLNSAGTNGTWHQYSITSGTSGNLSFVLDRQQVASVGFRLQPSKEPPMLVAEKVTTSNEVSSLGPVEFENLSYSKGNDWRAVDSLVSLNGCGIDRGCSTSNPYGVSPEGPNHIIAGSGGAILKSGQLLWTSDYFTLSVTVGHNVQFHVTTIIGDQEFTTSANVKVPKNLFADVTLATTKIRTEGLLGLIGAVDEFQGWTGYENSANESIRILINQNKSLQATWHTNLNGVLYTSAFAVVFLVAILGLVVLRLRHSPARKISYSQRQIADRRLSRCYCNGNDDSLRCSTHRVGRIFSHSKTNHARNL